MFGFVFKKKKSYKYKNLSQMVFASPRTGLTQKLTSEESGLKLALPEIAKLN